MLEPNRALWKGKLRNCFVLLRINALIVLIEYDLVVAYPHGIPIEICSKI